MTIGEGTQIFEPVVFVHKEDAIIGENCRIGQYCFIAPRKLTMEHGAEISPMVVLGGGGDIYMCKYSTINYGAKLIPATFTTKGEYMNDIIMLEDESKVDIIRGSIRLEEGAVVATNAVVCVSKKCPNIVIGKHSVVGANTFISESIPPNTIVHPTKNLIMKKRFEDASP